MIRFCVAVFVGSLQFYGIQAQYVKVGDGNILGSTAGPFITNSSSNNASSRYAYIYAKSVLGNLKHGDTLRSIEFRRGAGFGMNSSTALKIYISNTSASDFGSGKLYWPGEISSAKLVYFQSPQFDVGVKDNFYKFGFSSAFVMDTTKGDNLEIFVEYTQTATQQAIINWYYDNRFGITGYAQNQVKYSVAGTLQDSLPNSTDVHPMMILNYPRFDMDLEVIKLYTLGKLPIPLGNPDSMQVLIRNVGRKNLASARVYVNISGSNKLSDSTSISINAGEQVYKYLKSMYPTKKGIDTVTVFVNDKNNVNNSAFTVRQENANVYSYRDITLPPSSGGIGFASSTGDFVAKFLSNKPKAINQVTVNFGYGGSAFRIGIWDNAGSGVPGTLLYQSDSLISIGGTYILDLKSPVSINGSFFVGVRQLTNSNVAFGYQNENPARPGAFFYTTPLGSSSWTDFYPNAPYKFLIEPRLQADTDLAVIGIVFPKDSFDKYTMDTIAPVVKVGNIGARDINDSFSITAKIFLYGSLQYSKTIRDTMSAGIKRNYTFPKTFKPVQIGEYEIIAFVKYAGDQVYDNDSARKKFYIGIKKDVLFQDVYDPSEGQVFNYLKDTLVPVGTVKNAGYDNTPLFTTRCVIKNKTKTIYNKTISLKLLKFESRILNFPFYRCMDTGKWEVLFITELSNDAGKDNDTVRRTIFIRKYFDLFVDSVITPKATVFYTKNVAFKPTVMVFNDGVLPAFDAKLICRIRTNYSNQVYFDTVLFNCQAQESKWVQMNKIFVPARNGIYTISFKTVFAGDYVNANDSIKYDFYVGYPYDYSAVKILEPLATDTLISGNGAITPRLQLLNNGFVKNSDLVPVVFQIWNGSNKIYQDIKSLNLDTGQTFVLPMANFFPIAGGLNRMIAYTNYASDVRRKNDTALGTFYVSIGRDAYVLSIDSPSLNEYTAGVSKVPLAVKIGNNGKLKMDNVQVNVEIHKGDKLLFSAQKYDTLVGGEIKNIIFNQSYTPMDSGRFKVLSYTFHSADQYIYNDSQVIYFNAVKDADAVPDFWITPASAGIIVIDGIPFKPEISVKNTGSDSGLILSGTVFFYIRDSLSGSLLFVDSTGFINLLANTSINLSSTKSFTLSLPATYIFTAIVKSPVDIFADNDTLVMNKLVQFNSTNSIDRSEIRIFPNPASSKLFIDHRKTFTVVVYDNLMRRIAVPRSGNYLEVSALPSGMYYLKITDSAGEHSFSFMKE